MKNEMDELEQLLHSVRPATPPGDLLKRLAATLPPEPAPAVSLPVHALNWKRLWLRWVTPLAVAGAAVLVCVWHVSEANRPAAMPGAALPDATTALRPVQFNDCLLGARDLGIYRAPDGRAWRVVQGIGMGQKVWEEAASGRQVKQLYPQQQLLLVGLNTD